MPHCRYFHYARNAAGIQPICCHISAAVPAGKPTDFFSPSFWKIVSVFRSGARGIADKSIVPLSGLLSATLWYDCRMIVFPRNIGKDLKRAISNSPVLLLNGARQTGKSTLVQALTSSSKAIKYISLDNPSVLAAASDPITFIGDLPQQVIIDEIQRAPELLLAIKQSVDENRKPGRFILTGSANVLVLPKLSESLAGRMIIKTLWPLSQGEITNVQEGFIDALFAQGKLAHSPAIDWSRLVKSVARGGFPNMVNELDKRTQRDWFDSYLRTLLERDVRDISRIDGLRLFPFLLSILAGRVGNAVNFADVGRACGIPKTSIIRYMSLLEGMFLTFPVPAWYRNLEKRLIKSPKLYFCDSGFLARLLNMGAERLYEDRAAAGFIVENFVATELMKQLSWSKTLGKLFHFRTQEGQEVDFVIESDSGHLVGIEVKCANSVNQDDFKGLKFLAQISQKRFHRGIVLYTGKETISFGQNLYALPISALWHQSAVKAFDIFGRAQK